MNNVTYINNADYRKTPGFTLIELSIVLVIIGLIVGGILVGQDLISAAKVRSQISQIEKYQAAVNTFRVKYGYLPGDIPNPTASGFGFKARGTRPAQGDGNGLIEGSIAPSWTNTCGVFLGWGEPLMFWVDLSTANLIDGSFNTAVFSSVPDVSGSTLNSYLPRARISDINYIHVFNASCKRYSSVKMRNFKNYFTIIAFTELNPSGLEGLLLEIPGYQYYKLIT